ncbi:hypothetical protein [Desulfovibrio sp.]|uniref:beta strand repeat-containing protein n=1 Tax=Desulfovibrio sp. TaxID=885 RepID=UPI00258A889F|nr:hypothetical protein [Desulfovibrio sp.]
MTSYEHFLAYGDAENISPNAMFNVAEYLKSKADQLNALGEEKTDWTEADVLAAFNAAGLSAWDHYTQFGMYEGVNPSNQFDTSDYLEAKLAQLQADEPDKNWTMDSMLDTFKEAGLNPLEHYAQFGSDEGLSVIPVPADERVITDFDPYTPSNPGETFTLTTAVDTITGTANDDVINGVVSSLSADRTLNPEDSIDGAEGNDTLNVSMQGNFSGFTTGSMVNVEKVVLTNEGSIARSFSAKGIDGVDTWTLNDKGAAVNLTDLSAAGVTVNVQGLAQGSTTIGFTADAVKGDNDALTLGLNNVGTAKDGNTAAQYVDVTANGIENLAVKVTDDSYVNLSKAGSKTVTASGAGDLDVKHVATTLTSFDASALSGNVKAVLSGATLSTVKGGSGDDTITVTNLTANAVIEGGAGNDSLILQGYNGILQPTMSGFENVTANGGTLTISGKNVSDFNSLTVQNSADVTLANVDASAFTVTASGSTAGSVKLNDATAFTYNTVSGKTDKTSDSISTSVSASQATSATVNVGEYTQVTGTLDFAAASDVTVNVASGLSSDGKNEMTSFGATVNANKTQNLTVNAKGALNSAEFNVNAATSVLVDAAKGSTGLKILADKATDVSITAGADMVITDSHFTGAQNVTLIQNKGVLTGANVNLAAVNHLTLSGADNTSKVILGQLGNSEQEYGITVDASGLKAGLTLGNTDAGKGDVTLNLAEVTGAVQVGTVDGNNVTVQAAQLGTTSLGAITADGNVSIDAMGVLGGSASAPAVNVGSVTATAGDNQTISVQFDGNSDMIFGALTADTVNLDASGYLGSIVNTNDVGGTVDAAIGAITADTVDIKGSEIGKNTFGSAANTDNFITANTLTYTGGLDVDTVFLTGKSGTDMNVRLDTGAGIDNVTLTGIASTTKITVTGDMGGDNGDKITVTAGSSNAININLSGLTGYSKGTITGVDGKADTLTGGSGDDTIIAGEASFNVVTPVIDVMTGGAGADKFVAGVATSPADTGSSITARVTDFSHTDGDHLAFTGGSAADSTSNYEEITGSANLANFINTALSKLDGTKVYVSETIGDTTYVMYGTTSGKADALVELQGVSTFGEDDIVAA